MFVLSLEPSVLAFVQQKERRVRKRRPFRVALLLENLLVENLGNGRRANVQTLEWLPDKPRGRKIDISGQGSSRKRQSGA